MRLTLALAAALAPALLIAACTPRGEAPGPDAAAAPPPVVLRRTLTTPRALDPALVVDVGGVTVTGDTFEGLYRVGPGGAPVLAAASDHAVSPDGLTHTFTLRPGGRWSDGQPVTAADFAWSWRRALAPATAAPGAATLHGIAGARACTAAPPAEAAAACAAIGVEARDARTLVVRLDRPEPTLRAALTQPVALPVPRAVVEGHGDRWTRPDVIVSNGMWVPSEQGPTAIIARRNPHYDDGTPIPFDAIEYVIVEDETAAHNLYATGKLDYLAGKVPAAVIATLRRERSPTLRRVPFAGVDFYLFNTTRPPFDDPRVRRALSLALDRSVIGEAVLEGGELAAGSLIPPALGGRAASDDDFDPDRARALLAEAGHGPERPLRFALTHDESEPARRLAEYAQQQWRRHLGAHCDLRSMERRALVEVQRARDYDVSRAAWFADVPDALGFLEPWLGDAPANRTGWRDPAFDAAVAAIAAAPDEGARRAAIAAAEARLLDALPAMPTFVHVRVDLVRPGLLGHDPGTGLYQPARLLRFAR
ncbi:MAG: peptide ABC transporter substrate-binding protein [Myxococcales bacterium]|nr:peptide ABC transporter substrate-binding protein [Myxococcales bacterium]MCB9553283.1 peptide ABC transporter substrate-binding protein [Myxococcales bacterium]